MITISLCMIVKNEEAVLARCLDSVKDAADEIIIVDTGSRDATKEVAGRYTDKIYDFEWVSDFSAARNEAFSKAAMDYRMWLDADDILPPDELGKLIELKKTLTLAVDIVTMKYYTHFDAMGNPIHTSTRGRLFKRVNDMKWQDPIHEFIPLVGNLFHSDIVIHHGQDYKEGRENRNINIYEKLEESGAEMTPRQLYYYARELKDHGRIEKAAQYFEKFLDTGNGWSEDNISSCHNLAMLYNALGMDDKILPILTRAFLYGAPRAEICSEIGYYYKRAKDMNLAYKWFKTAAGLEDPDTIGFILRDYWGYIPNIECCVCAYELGDFEKAVMYNERAAAYKPDDPSVVYNRKVFGVA